MEKVDFKTTNLKESFDQIKDLDHRKIFTRTKCIFESSRVDTNWDFINGIFSMSETVPEMILGLMFANEFPDGLKYRMYQTIRNIKQSLGAKTPEEYKVYFNPDNQFGWIDEDTFRPNVKLHKKAILEMIHFWVKEHNGTTILGAMENLQQASKELCNWESFAILITMWDDICDILGLRNTGPKDEDEDCDEDCDNCNFKKRILN